MKFESLGECGEYLTGLLVLEIPLPAKAPYCQYCPMAKYEESFKRYSCRAMRRENWLFNPLHSRPEWCPIQFESEE